MKRGDLCEVYVTLDSHPRDDYFNGMLVVILGEKYQPTNDVNREYVKGLGDKVRMFPTRWLKVLQ